MCCFLYALSIYSRCPIEYEQTTISDRARVNYFNGQEDSIKTRSDNGKVKIIILRHKPRTT